ncbi:DUF4291 family protein, partial [Actinoplanes subtropicus]|uniref:DUF4291 family protein n=1 Tax=Actinoplanes subtropicus TaxID=543632 RepID=UPI000559365E
LQLGLSGEAIDRYVDEWTIAITDITPTVHDIHAQLKAGDHQAAAANLPAEHVYPLPHELRPRIDASPPA